MRDETKAIMMRTVDSLTDRCEHLGDRIAELEAALRKARPYVKEFADNCPSDDGGAEAVADLAAIDAALQAR